MAQHATLFDETMRQKAEWLTYEAEALQRQLTAAEARITALEREREQLLSLMHGRLRSGPLVLSQACGAAME